MAGNSIRVNGTVASHIANVRFKNVAVKFGRWTDYPGGVYDNRPTKVLTPIETHAADGFNLRFADNVSLENCSAGWGLNAAVAFKNSVAAENVTGLKIQKFSGDSTAHPMALK